MTTICPDPKRPLMSFASSLRPRSSVHDAYASSTRKALAELAASVEQGAIKPLVKAVHPLSEIGRAHRAMEAGGLLGKQIVRLK